MKRLSKAKTQERLSAGYTDAANGLGKRALDAAYLDGWLVGRGGVFGERKRKVLEKAGFVFPA